MAKHRNRSKREKPTPMRCICVPGTRTALHPDCPLHGGAALERQKRGGFDRMARGGFDRGVK